MPPKAITKCLKLGEILLDENRKMIFLCSHCFTDFARFSDLRTHKNCNTFQRIFKAKTTSKLNISDVNGAKLLTKLTKVSKELLIYGFKPKSTNEEQKNQDDLTDLLKIEEELLDPRWYNNDAMPKNLTVSYNDLLEEVTPFVQFKENVKSNLSPQTSKRGERARGSAKQLTPSKPISSPSDQRLTLSADKKQVLRRSIQQVPKQGPTCKKSTEQQIKSVSEKITRKTETKSAGVSHITKNQASLTNKKIAIKRKAESLPESRPLDIEDGEQVSKRRKTLGQRLQPSIQPTPNPKPKDPVTKPPPPPKIYLEDNTVPSALLIQKEIFASKEISNTNIRTAQNRSQSQLLDNNKLLPKKPIATQLQTLPQLEISRTDTNCLQASSVTLPKRINKTQVQKSPQVTKRMPIHMPAAPSTSIVKSYPHVISVKETILHPANTNQKTVEILNKLQTLGLKVQRTNPHPEPCLNDTDKTSNSNKQALEIIKKLQSKGMNVKIVQKPSTAATKVSPLQIITTIHDPSPLIRTTYIADAKHNIPISSSKKSLAITDGALITKSNFRRNILIKKCT